MPEPDAGYLRSHGLRGSVGEPQCRLGVTLRRRYLFVLSSPSTNQDPDGFPGHDTLPLGLAFHAYVAQLLTFACLDGEGFIEILPQEWLRPESRLVALPCDDSLYAESALGVGFDFVWTRIVGTVGLEPDKRARHGLIVLVQNPATHGPTRFELNYERLFHFALQSQERASFRSLSTKNR